MNRQTMIETLSHELQRQADASRAQSLYFDPNYATEPLSAMIDGYLNLGALADAIGVRMGLCTVTATFGESEQIVEWRT